MSHTDTIDRMRKVIEETRTAYLDNLTIDKGEKFARSVDMLIKSRSFLQAIGSFAGDNFNDAEPAKELLSMATAFSEMFLIDFLESHGFEDSDSKEITEAAEHMVQQIGKAVELDQKAAAIILP